MYLEARISNEPGLLFTDVQIKDFYKTNKQKTLFNIYLSFILTYFSTSS